MKNVEFKILESEDVYDITNFLKKYKWQSEKTTYVDPYLTDADFMEETIRNNCFNFSRIYIARMVNRKISNLCFLEVSQYPYLTKSIELKFISDFKNDNLALLEYMQNNIKDIFEECNKIVLNVQEDRITILQELISMMQLKKEIVLNNEFGNRKNLIVFSKFI